MLWLLAFLSPQCRHCVNANNSNICSSGSATALAPLPVSCPDQGAKASQVTDTVGGFLWQNYANISTL